MKKLYILLSIVAVSATMNAQVVISQVYGGGGNAGATYSNDFIEIFNAGSTAQSLSGWSVQYTSANGPSAGTNWAVTNLPSITLNPGQYFLIQEAVGATLSTSLPTPDVDGIACGCTYTSSATPTLATTGIAMSGSNGKVLLSNSTVAESTATPTGAEVMDKVAYGTTSTSGFEGTGPTGTALSSTTSAQRNYAGCMDTNNNATDFTAAQPAPRNTATALHLCTAASTSQFSIAGLKVYANNKTLYVTSDSSFDKTVAVYDMLGKEVTNGTISNQGMNISNLATGAYIVKVSQDGNVATTKLLVE